MEDEDYARYAADIQLMTAILSGTRQEAKPSWNSTAARKKARPFIHLANLLTTDAETSLAVAGSLASDRVAFAIVVSSPPAGRTQAEAPMEPGAAPFELVSVLPHGPGGDVKPISMEDVLDADPSKVPDIAQHARDVFQVLKYVHEGTCHIYYAKRWVVSRCRQKLGARMRMMHTSWRNPDLITLLKSWKPAPNEAIAGCLDLSPPKYAFVVDVFAEWGVLDEEKHVQLSGDGAARFVGCLASMLERAKETLLSAMEPNDLTFVSELLSVLQVLFSHEKTKWLFTQTSLARHAKPCRDEVNTGESGAEVGIVAEELPAFGTDNEDFAYRYLLTLTAHSVAMDYLCWDRVLPHLQNCSATVVKLREPPTQPSSSHQFLFDAIDGYWAKSPREGAKEILRRKLASAGDAGCRVHAEAGLMALELHLHSATVEVSADMQGIAAAFEHIGALPVGVTEKCCWACTRLSQRLLKDNHAFTLPGAQGMVCPWSPPPFGVPPDVLRVLRDDLIATVVQWAIAQADREPEPEPEPEDAGEESSPIIPEFKTSKPPMWTGSLGRHWLDRLQSQPG